MERAARIAYIVCNGGFDSSPPTPLQIFSGAMIQTLQVNPEILTIPQNISKLTLQGFEDIHDSPEMAFKLLADILQMANEKCRHENTEMFLLIDRFFYLREMCQATVFSER